MLNRKELKEKAKAQLRTRWGDLILVCFIYALLMSFSGATVIGTILLGGPLTIGLAIYMSKFVRTGERRLDNLFNGFDNFGENIFIGLLYGLFVALWSLLLLIPGIVKSYSYAACFYIKQAKPEWSATECITKSREIMNGHKGELFVMDLSFIGWHILTWLTCGIGYLWLFPYIYVTKANYFVQLLREAGIMPKPAAKSDSDDSDIKDLENNVK